MFDSRVNLLIKAGLKFYVDKCVVAICVINLSIPKFLKLYDADLPGVNVLFSVMFLFGINNVSS